MSAKLALHSKTLASDIGKLTGLNPARCYQCGKCSAGCPMAAETDLRPHDILRLVQRNQRARLFGSEAPWLCLTCETCTARCPNQVEPARVIDAVRELVLGESGRLLPRRVRAFHRSFLRQIRRYGRVSELRMVAAYKLASGAIFDDILEAPGMLVRGKLPLAHRKIDGVAEVRRIFAACRAAHEGEP